MSAPPEIDERGQTTVDSRVVRKIIARAVTEVDGVGSGAKANATVDGSSATVDVRLSVAYPASVARTTEAAREHLIRRTAELTGITAERVDIVVETLCSNGTKARRVL